MRVAECPEEVAPENDEEYASVSSCPNSLDAQFSPAGTGIDLGPSCKDESPRMLRSPGAGIDGLLDYRDRGYYYEYVEIIEPNGIHGESMRALRYGVELARCELEHRRFRLVYDELFKMENHGRERKRRRKAYGAEPR